MEKPKLSPRDIESFERVVDFPFKEIQRNLEDLTENINGFIPVETRKTLGYENVVASLEEYHANVKKALENLRVEYSKTEEGVL